MATVQAIKQYEEKVVPIEITLMIWSNKIDLVALANIKGVVSLHRLSWTQAWTLNPPKEGLTVKKIGWRPDGKIIAIAYSSGEVILVKVENKTILHTIVFNSEVTCINWVQDKANVRDKTLQGILNDESVRKQYMENIDLSSNFLSEFSDTTESDTAASLDEMQKTDILQDQNDLNLLTIGTIDGFVHVQVFGCFACATFDLHNAQIEAIHFSDNLNRLLVTTRNKQNTIQITCIDTIIFQTHANELYAVALKQVKLMSLITYLHTTITTITESFESILLEMDNKLAKYAGKVAEGGVTADFLDLLMFGICSEEMKEFLIHDLTKKGLEKFGHTIEMCYYNIEKLLLKYVMKFGQNITYHLAEIRGMARLEYRYKVLGLFEDDINEAILSNGAFLIKGGEMQQIINHSIINYKACFRWLYSAIMRLMEEPISSDGKMTQQDLAYIVEFLQNFDHIGKKSTPMTDSNQGGFSMERLGQYLNDANLTIKPDMSGNDWLYFLKQNTCVQNHASILKHFQDMSLIQNYKHLKLSIEMIFQKPKDYINQQFKILQTYQCFEHCDRPLKVSQINMGPNTVLVAFLSSPRQIYCLQIDVDDGNLQSGTVVFPHFLSSEIYEETCYNIIDMQFYSKQILSVLLQENAPGKATVLNQVPLTPLVENLPSLPSIKSTVFSNDSIVINGSNLTPKLFKNVDGMVGVQLAVSGTRKLGIILAENGRKVKLYEMEGEEEEDEDADMSNSVFKDSIDNITIC